MKYIDEFRNKKLVKGVSQRIFEIMPNTRITIMEVCGTHTQNFRRFGLDKLIPENLRLVSGPGCPVCVSTQDYIDRAIQLSKQPDIVIVTFGDMLRVPGTYSSLEKQRAEGMDVRVVYSAWDGLEIARSNPRKSIIFLAVGFETTAPTIALTLQAARKEKMNNLFFFSTLKLIPPAMKALVSDGKFGIDGFLCPGHVSTIIGSQAYEFIPRRYKIPCCIAGFEPLDILEGLYFLLCQIIHNRPCVSNQYIRAVKKEGNPRAKAIINAVFKPSNATWRGLGKISNSGLRLRDEYSSFDTEKKFSFNIQHKTLNIKQSRCRCPDVLKGIIQPDACLLFRKVCTPSNPYGPCMVSSEGACNVYYQYK
jgi:hydrogenase expression/formation protein HypD